MQGAPRLSTRYLSFGDGHNWSRGGAVADLKWQGRKAILFITEEWPAFTHSQITVLFAGLAPTTTPPITSWSMACQQTQTRCRLAGTNRQQQTWGQVVIPLTCFNCSFYCAHELPYKLFSLSHVLFLYQLLCFSSVRTSFPLLLSLLHLNTASKNTKVCGL